jgi:hypothetical protein
MDASIVPGASGFKRNSSEDDLLATLEMALSEDQPEHSPQPPITDHVIKYHEMMRRALVDWGDEIIDTLCAKFADVPRITTHIEAVRVELIDPLRASLS